MAKFLVAHNFKNIQTHRCNIGEQYQQNAAKMVIQ